MTEAKRINSIETSHELPVEGLFSQEMNAFMDVHKELSKLPQDPKDPLLPAIAMLRDVGVEVDSDFGDIIMGAMGKIGMDMAMDAVGMATQGSVATGIDLASGFLMGLSEARKDDPKYKKDMKAGATSMFRLSKKKEPEKAPKATPSTSILRDAMKRKRHLQLKGSENKRKMLKAKMAIHLKNVEELAVFKRCGVSHAHRVTVPNGQTGETETYMVAAKEKPHMALQSNGKAYEKPIDVSMVQKPGMAPKMAMGF
ncbi:MAG: hypothetical protein EBQ96_02890 [Proteobacteria bacterium]|nr:hypothetical protein [Pseudomonadota bacterium]